jgi:dihydroxyacetone kinase
MVSDAHLTSSEIEIGMGIHNEAGFQRVSPVPPLSKLVQTLLDLLLSQSDPERGFLSIQGSGKDNVVLLVNNLGGVSELELAGIARETITALSARGIRVLRVISGTFMVTHRSSLLRLSGTHPDVAQTSLNMPGFSLTLLLLPTSSSATAPSEDVILRLLDASTSSPGWKWTSCAPPSELPPPPAALASERAAGHALKVRAQDVQGFVHAVERASNALDKAEPEITRMDTISGDGDCGLTLQTGAHGMQSHEIPLFTRADRTPSCTRTSPRWLNQRRRRHRSPHRCV